MHVPIQEIITNSNVWEEPPSLLSKQCALDCVGPFFNCFLSSSQPLHFTSPYEPSTSHYPAFTHGSNGRGRLQRPRRAPQPLGDPGSVRMQKHLEVPLVAPFLEQRVFFGHPRNKKRVLFCDVYVFLCVCLRSQVFVCISLLKEVRLGLGPSCWTELKARYTAQACPGWSSKLEDLWPQ